MNDTTGDVPQKTLSAVVTSKPSTNSWWPSHNLTTTIQKLPTAKFKYIKKFLILLLTLNIDYTVPLLVIPLS